MGAVTITAEFSTSVSAQRMFKAMVLDAHNLFPKLSSHLKGAELIEGPGGPGSIEKLTFDGGVVLKYRVDAVDEGSMTHKVTMLEGTGDAMVEKLESVTYENKFESTGDGGCKCTQVATYNPKGGAEVKEEEIKAGRDKGMILIKAVEAHLLANPGEYA